MTNHIVLFEPLFPANTGNIARTCAGTNTELHLIKPLGFSTDDKHMKRAGLDYWDKVKITYHEDLPSFMKTIPDINRLYIVSKFATHDYSDADYTGEGRPVRRPRPLFGTKCPEVRKLTRARKRAPAVRPRLNPLRR